MNFLQELLQAQDAAVDQRQFLSALALTILSSFVLGRAYIYWGHSLSNRRKLASNFVLIALATCFIITIVKSSIALSLGLVGALSITRFRSAVKDPEELTFLFLSIAMGIGYGANFVRVSLLALLVTVLVLYLRHRFAARTEIGNYHLIVGTETGAEFDLKGLTDLLQQHSAGLELVRLDQSASQLEVSFNIAFPNFQAFLAARDAVNAFAPGVAVTFMDPTVGA